MAIGGDDEALRVLDGFAFDTPENQRTVKEQTTAFESYALGDIHETLERYKFGGRDQQEGEPIDTYISTLRSMLIDKDLPFLTCISFKG